MSSSESSSSMKIQLVRKTSRAQPTSSIREAPPSQTAEPNPLSIAHNNERISSDRSKSRFITTHTRYIMTDIPFIFTTHDMPYLKEKYGFPSYVILSASKAGERADSLCEGWICSYEIAFKVGLHLPLHRFINTVLDFFNLAPGQLMPNYWRYLLGLIFLSEMYGQPLDMPIFLLFFYPKLREEGRYTFYARWKIHLLDDVLSSDKNWKDRYFFVKREGLFDPVGSSLSGIRSTWAG